MKYRDIGEIKWPHCCAVCGGAASRLLAVDSSAVKGFVNLGIGVVVVSKVTRVCYPICKEHFFSSWVASGLSQRSLFGLAMGVLSSLPILSILVAASRSGLQDALPKFSITTVLLLALPAIFWSLFFWAKRKTPVRIGSTNPDSIVFVFQSEEYAAAFAKANDKEVRSSAGQHTVRVHFFSQKEKRDEMNRIAEEGDLAFKAHLPKSENPYLAQADLAGHELLASYWERGFEAAEKRHRASSPKR